MTKPENGHQVVVTKLLKYLKRAPGQGIQLIKDDDFELKAFSDADWGSCRLSRRWTSGYVIFLGCSSIPWKSIKQSVVARSLDELGIKQNGVTIVYYDNQAAVLIAMNLVFNKRTKHVEMDCYLVCERVQTNKITPVKSNAQQLADIFTKALVFEISATL